MTMDKTDSPTKENDQSDTDERGGQHGHNPLTELYGLRC